AAGQWRTTPQRFCCLACQIEAAISRRQIERRARREAASMAAQQAPLAPHARAAERCLRRSARITGTARPNARSALMTGDGAQIRKRKHRTLYLKRYQISVAEWTSGIARNAARRSWRDAREDNRSASVPARADARQKALASWRAAGSRCPVHRRHARSAVP